MQWTLFTSTNLNLEHLSTSNYFPSPLTISTEYTLNFSPYLEPLFLELLNNFDLVATIISLFRLFT